MSFFERFRPSLGRRGFSVIEIIMVTVIGTILVSLVIRGFGSVHESTSVSSARQTFAAYHTRARAYAVENGTSAFFKVDATGDSVWVEQGGQIVDVMKFGDDMNVDLSMFVPAISLCLNPRGFADRSCNSFAGATTVTFTYGNHTSQVTVHPLGQLEFR